MTAQENSKGTGVFFGIVAAIGGIMGTVMDVKEDEITLKVDESNNTKIKVAPSAIGRNLSQDKG